MAPPPSGPRGNELLGKRSYTLRLTFSSIVTAGIVLIIGISWAFVLGVMVGRGYNPEKKVPQLATLLPAEQESTKAAREKLGDTLPKAEVMKPEDLRYASSLKGKPGQPPAEIKPKNMQNATVPVVAPPPTSIPSTAPGHAPQPTEGIVEQARPRSEAPRESPKDILFDYVFQVATFKDAESVDKLRARLEGKGLRTRMDKDGKLLKIMVLLRGSQESAQNIQQQMVDMGLGQPIQRSRTPVRNR